MLDRWISLLLLLAALGSGLVAGVFFAFSSFVMAALGRVAPAQGMAAMQAINVTVINPLFMSVFLGTGVLSVLIMLWALGHGGEPAGSAALAGALCTLVLSIGVTMVFNVPLNNALASADPASAAGTALWADYLTRWTWWNHVRGFASLAALAAFILARG